MIGRLLLVSLFLLLAERSAGEEVTVDFQHHQVLAENHNADLVEYVRSTLAESPPLVPRRMPGESIVSWSSRFLGLKDAMDNADISLSLRFNVEPQFSAVSDQRPVSALGIPIFSRADPPKVEVESTPMPGAAALLLGCIDPARLRTDDGLINALGMIKSANIPDLSEDEAISLILRPKVIVTSARPSEDTQKLCAENGRRYVRFSVGRRGSRLFVNRPLSVSIAELSRVLLWGGNNPDRLRSEASRTYYKDVCVDLSEPEANEAVVTGDFDEVKEVKIGGKVVLVFCRYETLKQTIDDAIYYASMHARKKSGGNPTPEGIHVAACHFRFGSLPDDLGDLAAIAAQESVWTLLLCDERPRVAFLAAGQAAASDASWAFCLGDPELGNQLAQFSPSAEQDSTEHAFRYEYELAAYLDIMPILSDLCLFLRPSEAVPSAQAGFLDHLSGTIDANIPLGGDLSHVTIQAVDSGTLTWLAYSLGLLQAICRTSPENEPCTTLRDLEERGSINAIDKWRGWPDRSSNVTLEDDPAGLDVSAPVFLYVAAEDLFSSPLQAALKKVLVRERNSVGDIIWPVLATSESTMWNIDFDIFQTPIRPFDDNLAAPR